MVTESRIPQGPLTLRLLPPQVEMLPGRERELAGLIYQRGAMTANEVGALLDGALSNSAIRSMLQRLCKKGILKRRKRPLETRSVGKRIAFLYIPAVDDPAVRHKAIRQVARDYFDGSLLLVRQAADEMLKMPPGRDPMREARRSAG